MAKKNDIEVQKGPIEVGLPTYRTQSTEQRVAQMIEQKEMRRGYQKEHLHEPKR